MECQTAPKLYWTLLCHHEMCTSDVVSGLGLTCVLQLHVRTARAEWAYCTVVSMQAPSATCNCRLLL